MLAQNFKTAAELEISEAERSALIKVLGMFEREEISPTQFSMSRWDCGTTACIGGWARRIGGKGLLTHVSLGTRGIDLLCYPDTGGQHIGTIPMAAAGLRNFLTTGDPCWNAVLAAH